VSLLSTAELAEMRATQLEALPDTATILRRSLTSDGRGGQAESYSEAGSAACRISFEGGNKPIMPDSVDGGRPAPQERFIVTLPHDADVLETDRLTIGDDTFEIVTSLAARSWQTAKRMLVKRV
jgi:hypothetical protein